MQPRHDVEQIKAKCLSIIDSHVHREALNEGDIRAWVEAVAHEHGELAIWHAIRAGGFGGSEIGVLVRNHQGHRADHQNSAHDIIEGKLLRRLPDSESGPMRRGHDNEPRHATWFYEKYACSRDEKAYQALSKASAVRPWMRYSPDDVVLRPTLKPNPALGGACFVRWLVDYKAPGEVEPDAEVAFQYACQLHQGAMLCAATGTHLDGMVLSQFDWRRWALKDDAVPYDADLAQQIVAAGDHYWAYVLRGEVPRYVTTPRFEREEELRKDFEEHGTRLAQLLAMSKALEVQVTQAREVIAKQFEPYRLAGSRLNLGELGVSSVVKVDHDKVLQLLQEEGLEDQIRALSKRGASPSYDAEAMARHLRSLGVPLKQFARPKFDDALVFEFLADHGQDPQAFMKEELRMSASVALQQQAQDLVRETFGAAPPPPHSSVEQAHPGEKALQPMLELLPSHERAQHEPDQAGEAGAGQEQETDREGLHTERYAPRSISA